MENALVKLKNQYFIFIKKIVKIITKFRAKNAQLITTCFKEGVNNNALKDIFKTNN